MNGINKKINDCRRNSYELKKIYLGGEKGNKDFSWDKSQELRRQQNEEWNKLQFFKNLKKEMEK